MSAAASIDLTDDENQLLLIGLAYVVAAEKPPLPGARELLEKLAGDGAEEFLYWARLDLEIKAAEAVSEACRLTLENWINPPPEVEPILNIVCRTVELDCEMFGERTSLKTLMQAARAGEVD